MQEKRPKILWSQFFFVLLQLSCCGWLAMSRWLGKNPWLGTILKLKTFAWRFFWPVETWKISNHVQNETAVGVYPLCIYTWHRCAPSSEGVRSVLSYIYLFGVGFCCFLSLTWKAFPGPLQAKIRLWAARFLRHHFIIAIQFLIIFSTKGVGGARKRGEECTSLWRRKWIWVLCANRY